MKRFIIDDRLYRRFNSLLGLFLSNLVSFLFLFFVAHLPIAMLCVGGFVQFLYICHLIIFFIKDSISRRDCGDMLLLFLGDYNWVSVSFWPTYFLFCLCGCFLRPHVGHDICLFFYCFCVCGDFLLFFVSFFCHVSVSTMSPKIRASKK